MRDIGFDQDKTVLFDDHLVSFAFFVEIFKSKGTVRAIHEFQAVVLVQFHCKVHVFFIIVSLYVQPFVFKNSEHNLASFGNPAVVPRGNAAIIIKQFRLKFKRITEILNYCLIGVKADTKGYRT